jgi:hypothetical protein
VKEATNKVAFFTMGGEPSHEGDVFMDEALIEVARLIAGDDFKTAILAAGFCAVPGLIWAVPKAVVERVRRRRAVAYDEANGAISFSRDEFMAALEVYVPHMGMSTDPSAKVEMLEALMADRVDAFKYLDFFLEEAKSKHLLVLADCGMGKTTFLINYFYRRSKWFPRRGLTAMLVSLSKTGYASAIESVPIAERAKTVLLMDALDEDPLVLKGVSSRVLELLKLTEGFRAVVITCRSHFFRSDDDIPVATGALRAGPTPAGHSKEYEFNRLYLAPFDSKQVSAYLRKSMGGASGFLRRRKAKVLIQKVPSLIIRPMLLVHVADLLDVESKQGILSEWDLYQAITSAWAQREAHWIDIRLLLDFSTKLAGNLFARRHLRGGEYCSYSDLRDLASTWGISVKPELLAGRSLLNRTEDGRCKFAHRSILEYFVAKSIFQGSAGEVHYLTNQISRFILSRLGLLQRANQKKVEEVSHVELIAPLSRLGYLTNFSLLHVTSVFVNPASLYGLQVLDELENVHILGEFVQSLLRADESSGRASDVRITASERTSDGLVELYLSIWFEDRVLLSRLRVGRLAWQPLLGTTWSDREFYHIVGTFPANQSDSRSIRYNLATFSDTQSDVLGADGAETCSVIAAHNCPVRGMLIIRMIAGIVETGELGVFGILGGGSAALYEGRRYTVVRSRESNQSFPDSRVVNGIGALTSAPERWIYGRNN